MLIEFTFVINRRYYGLFYICNKSPFVCVYFTIVKNTLVFANSENLVFLTISFLTIKISSKKNKPSYPIKNEFTAGKEKYCREKTMCYFCIWISSRKILNDNYGFFGMKIFGMAIAIKIFAFQKKSRGL